MTKRAEPITFITNPNPQQLEAAADLVDEGIERKRPLKRNRFRKARVIVLVLNDRGQVVGEGAVMKSKGSVAEIGAVVHPDYRAQGTAKRVLQILLQEAMKQDIALLYARVRPTNVAAIRLVKRANFQFWGDYVKTNTTFSWFYLPLSTNINAEEIMRQKTANRTRVGLAAD